MLVVLAGLHLALGAWLLRTAPPTSSQTRVGAGAVRFDPVTVRLTPVREDALTRLRDPSATPTRPTLALVPALRARTQAPQAIRDPARPRPRPESEGPAEPTSATVLRSAGPAADTDARPPRPPPAPTPGPPALDLRLPPPIRSPEQARSRSPAQEAVDARVGDARRGGPAERMGRRLETEWTEERLPDGRVRMRRGEDCVDFGEARAAQIDPWNNRGTLPRGATSCPR